MATIPVAPALSTELRGATLRLSRRIRNEKADDELSDGQSSVLAYLERFGAQTPAVLSGFEHVSPPSMNRTLNALQQAGYVTRTPSPDDRRMVAVSITDAGRHYVQETRRRRDAWLDRHLETLDPREREILGEAAAIIRKLLEQ